MENKIEERKEKVKTWFKDPYHLILIGIIIAALIIRLYYFSMTANQPLWWDEAEYGLKAKSFAFGTPTTGWAPEREIIVPLIFALFLKFGFTEVALRFIQVLVSVATVFATYFVISKLTSKFVGIVASFAMAFFWLHIFFTERLLVYLWAPLLFLIIIYFFYTGYMQNNKRNTILFAIASAIGLQIYFSIGFLLFAIFIYLLITEGLNLFKNKRAWLVFLIFIIVMLPSFIYFSLTYGSPLPRYSRGLQATVGESGAGLSGIFAYIDMFPSRVGWTFTLLSFAGILYFLGNLLLGWGVKDHLKNNLNYFLLFIVFFIPLSLYTFYGVVGGSATFYDAFILPVFPFAFAFAGILMEKLYNLIKKYSKIIALIFVIVILSIHAYSGLQNADLTIKNKMTTYDSLKLAGQFIKQNSNPGDTVISSGVPEITYYSERATYPFPDNESDFAKEIADKKPKYLTLTIWESSPQWAYTWPQRNNQTIEPVQAYYLNTNQVSTVVYKFLDSTANKPL